MNIYPTKIFALKVGKTMDPNELKNDIFSTKVKHILKIFSIFLILLFISIIIFIFLSPTIITFLNNSITNISPPLTVSKLTMASNIFIYLFIFVIGMLLVYSSFTVLKSQKLTSNKTLLSTNYGKAILFTLIGISLVSLNILLTDIFLFITNNTQAILYQNKGWIAALGYTLYNTSLPYAITITIKASEDVRSFLNKIFGLLIILFGSITIIVIISIAGITSFPLEIVSIIGVFLVLINVVSLIILSLESRTSRTPARRNRIRIRFLIIAIFIFTVDFVFNFIDFLLSFPQYANLFSFLGSNFIQYKLIFEYIILPSTRIITYGLSLLFFYFAYFFPIWLQEYFSLLPPSYKSQNKAGTIQNKQTSY